MAKVDIDKKSAGRPVGSRQLIKLTKSGKPRCTHMVSSGKGVVRQCSNPALADSVYCSAHDPEKQKSRAAKLKGNRHGALMNLPMNEIRKRLGHDRTLEIAASMREGAARIADLKFQEVIKAQEAGETMVMVDDFIMAAQFAVRANESFHNMMLPPGADSGADEKAVPAAPAVEATINTLVVNIRRELKEKDIDELDLTAIPASVDAEAVESVPASVGQAT